MKQATLALTALASLLGCTVGPKYQRPDAPIAAQYRGAPAAGSAASDATGGLPPTPTTPSPASGDSAWQVAQPADTVPRGAWWTLFQDTSLNALEQQVAAQNRDVRAAEARFRQASALVSQVRSQAFPTLGLQAQNSRARTSANVQHRATAGITLPDYQIALQASWEPDLWGRVASSTEAARAGAQASAADAQGALLSMQAALAIDYFQLRATDQQIKLFAATVDTYQRALTLTRNRLAGGIATYADVARADTQLQTAQAQAIDLTVQRAQLEHAIAVLIGASPSTFTLPAADVPLQARAVPPGVPSTLLERRPDIGAAERRVAQANAQIGVATAAFFPTLTLGVTGGLESTLLSQLLTAPSRFWSLGPSLAASLIDFGQRRAVKEGAIAQYDETVAEYQQTVLTAFQQVEDQLSALQQLQQEAVVEQGALQAAQRALAAVNDRYRNGALTYLDVVVAQTTALDTQRTAIELSGRQMAASVGLIKALGGGWNTAALDSKALALP
ncbi:MAG: efflux transporter outer membrane subunit [Janthinobacterium lividum]